MEIASGEEKTIWEFLDDIWYYYSNKNRDISSRRKKNNIPIPIPLKAENISVDRKTLQIDEKNSYRTKVRDEEQKNFTIEKNLERTIKGILDNKPQETSHDLATIQKNIANDISNALNKNSKISKHDVSSRRGESSEKFSNSEIIALNLGMTKIKKKKENISISNISRANSERKVSSDQTVKKCEVESLSNLNISPYNQNIPTKSKFINHTINRTDTKGKNSKEKEKQKDCFVIFGKSNAQMLKKEIERYNTLGSACAYNSENSSLKNEERLVLTRSEKPNSNLLPHNYSKKNLSENIIGHPNIPRPQTKSKLIHYETDFSEKDFYLNFPKTENKITNRDDVKEDDFILKEWLMSIGSKSAYKIDFTCDEIEEFKDGNLFAEIISILENKNVPGINPNSKSKASHVKNISKCLEVLRNRKVNFVIIILGNAM